MTDALGGMKEMIAGLVMVAVIIGALALALNAFRDDMGNDNQCEGGLVFNLTDAQCYNSSGDLQAGAFTYQYNVTMEGLEGTANASSFLGTIGTMIGVTALLAIVVMAFYFATR